MKRKTISALLTFVLAATTVLVGCGDSSKKPDTSTRGYVLCVVYNSGCINGHTAGSGKEGGKSG